jgi:hypothetical protein
MVRAIDDKNILTDFCIRFCRIVEKYSEYIVVSGFVAIASGRMRGTEDIDMIIRLISKKNFLRLNDELSKNGFLAMQSDDSYELYSNYLTKGLSVRYTEKDSFVPEMELKFAKDALDEYQLKTKAKLPLTGLDIWFSSINMNLAFKEELLKSDKDLEDARHLRIVYKELVDEKEIDKIKKMIKRYRL